MQKKILIINNSYFISGAELSLFSFTGCCPDKYLFIYALSKEAIVPSFLKSKENVYGIPFKWFVKTINPLKIIYYFINLIRCTYHLFRISKTHYIDIIYANSGKSVLYGVALKMFTGKKLLWHMRDNFNNSVVLKMCARFCDKLIVVSDAISKQKSVNGNCTRIYAGIDTGLWTQKEEINKIGETDTIQIAQIGQLTRWKNHTDFIRMADILYKKYKNVHFIIVGDDLSGREKKYKEELCKLVNDSGLDKNLTFSGYRENIREIMNETDILVHTAINEPFGRVLIEAMSFEKPVLAYNCGGPVEIINDGINGYLVSPGDYNQMAEKVSCLIEQKELRHKLGKAGRQKVISTFNINRYTDEIQKVLDSM